MDITTSFFWQNVLLVALLTPYIVGIAASAYYTNTSATFGRAKSPAIQESTGEGRILGRLIATIGATLLAFVFSTTSIISVAWGLRDPSWIAGIYSPGPVSARHNTGGLGHCVDRRSGLAR